MAAKQRESSKIDNVRGELPGNAVTGAEAAGDAATSWVPLLDWRPVFPGNRGVDRNGKYDLFDAPLGIELRVEPSTPSERLLTADQPWEGDNMQPYATWRDAGGYHIIYGTGSHRCYATSADGYRWERPNLGQVEVDGSTANNVVKDAPIIGGVFEDPHASPAERFKSIGQDGGYFDPETGEQLESVEGVARNQREQEGGPAYSGPRAVARHWVVSWSSPDGINWTRHEEPVADFASDGGNSPQHDSTSDSYFDYIRVHGREPSAFRAIGAGVPEIGGGRRSIGLSMTDDFTHWPPPKLVVYPTPQDQPDVSFYGANYARYPGRDDIHLLFLQVYHQVADVIDNQLAVSHDGLVWYRHYEPIIPLGPTGSGYEGMCRTYAGGILELPDGNWAVSHECNPGLHNISGFRQYPERAARLGAVTNEPTELCSMRWARWKPHRLCGIEAPQDGQLTLSAVPRRTAELHLNYRCENGGYLIAELVRVVPSRLNPDLDGVPGFTFGECERLTGDATDEVVRWAGNTDISAVGNNVAVRIRMFRAKLFAFLV